jgi:multidrug efflux pump subunit AcrB
MDYPTVDVRLDREKLGRSKSDVRAITDSVVAATSSSRYVVPLYWPDPKTGIGFQVQVEVPVGAVRSPNELGLFIVEPNPSGPPLRLRDVATITQQTAPGEYDRYNMRRLISLTANLHGEDLGSAARKIAKALDEVGEPPRGVIVDVRGQIVPMQQVFTGLALGLLLAGVAIFLLLTGYFQSLRLALIVISTAPAVLAGVALALLVTGTTLNLQSFMGAIMALGVAVANAILMVTFADKHRRAGASAFQAGVEGARQRLRPILMTTCAMIAGMLPMALAFGEGGEQTAPLGRAVIGGLIASTLTTLSVLPFIFGMLAGAGVASASLDPNDPRSSTFDGDAARPANSFDAGGV